MKAEPSSEEQADTAKSDKDSTKTELATDSEKKTVDTKKNKRPTKKEPKSEKKSAAKKNGPTKKEEPADKEDVETTNKSPSKKAATKEKKAVPAKKGSNRSSWSGRVKECKEFSKKHGHCKIPTNCKDNNIGVWVQETRRNYKLMMQGKEPRRRLTTEQVDELEEVGFHWGFTPDPNKFPESDASWEANFAKLQEYKEENGDFKVPVESDTLKLAKWTRVQRNQYNLRATKRKTFITKERIKKLEGIDFDWDGPRKIDN